MTLVSAGWNDRALQQLASDTGTPLYVYDLERLDRTVDALRVTFQPFGGKLYFATMANDRPQVLQRLAELGVGACINSGPHFDLALQAGFATASAQFTSTSITADDMARLIGRRVRVNLDSFGQLEQWFSLGGHDPGIRVNAGSLTGAANADRIGLEASVLPQAIEIATRHGREIAGLHVYVGTNFQTPDEMAPTLRAFFAIAETMPRLRYVNIGGGLGVDYAGTGQAFDLAAYGRLLAALTTSLRAAQGDAIDVIVEPGRYLAAPCAVFLTRVLDDKKLNGQRYLGTDASIAIFPRPFHHPECPHRIVHLEGGADKGGPPDNATVVGRTTFSRDILGDVRIDTGDMRGELLMMENAGAYSQSMASSFLGQPEPAEVYLGARSSLEVAAE